MKLAAIVVLAVTIVTASSVVFVNARSAQTIDVRPCGASRTNHEPEQTLRCAREALDVWVFGV